MLVTAFLQWWYGPGWRDTASRLSARIQNIYLNFSLPILIRTLFAPWHRIITPPGSAMQDKFRAMVDNAISRAVGFSMRLGVLIAGLVIIGITAVAGGLILILWPFIPALGLILIVAGFVL